ncbi:MAG: histidine phosphatase family protein [Nitrospira sp.]|nr:histidine phosphatase family protein [Nitrospira sp.]
MIGQAAFRPTTIYLVRHGESQLNLEERVSGQLDTPLSQEGIRLSQMLAVQLLEVPLTGIYTSALRRTVETARPTAAMHGLSIQNNAALNEQHFGVLEGRFRDERDPEARALWEARKQDKRFYRIPGGECFIDLVERATSALKDILAHEVGGTILIVGHRNTNRALFGMLMQQPEDQWPHLSLKSQYIYRITTGSHPDLSTIAFNGKRTKESIDRLVCRHEQ